VCLNVVDENKEMPLECGHWMHLDCLRGWNKPNCPCCRAPYTDKERRRIIKNPCTKVLSNALYMYSLSLSFLSNEIMQVVDVRSREGEDLRRTDRLSALMVSELRGNRYGLDSIMRIFGADSYASTFMSNGDRIMDTPEARAAMEAAFSD